MNMEELNPLLAELGVGNKETFWKRTKSLGQHDTVKIKNLGSGVNTIDITGSQGQSPDDIPDQTGINAWDDEFEGTSLDTAGTRRSGAKAWTWYNQGSTTTDQNRGRQVLTFPGSISDNDAGVLQEAPTAPWVFRAKCQIVRADSTGNYGRAGIVAYNSSNNHQQSAVVAALNTGTQLTGYYADDFTASHVQNSGTPWSLFVPAYLEIEDDGTDLHMRTSGSGVDGTFLTIHTDSGYTSLGAAPTHVGLTVGVSVNNYALAASFEWWRRIS